MDTCSYKCSANLIFFCYSQHCVLKFSKGRRVSLWCLLKVKGGAREMVQPFTATVVLVEDLGSSLSITWRLRTTCNSTSKGFDTLLWFPWALGTQLLHTWRKNIHTHSKNLKWNIEGWTLMIFKNFSLKDRPLIKCMDKGGCLGCWQSMPIKEMLMNHVCFLNNSFALLVSLKRIVLTLFSCSKWH